MAISVVLNTYNAAKSLRKVLSCLKGFDEIVVCDMESTDDTVDIALDFGAKVVTFPKGHHEHCGPARNFAIRCASNEWVLVVDADELVTADLRKYLYKFIHKPGNVKGVYIPRKNYILDRFRRAAYPDYRLRFFLRDSVNWPPEFHARPIVEGDLFKIPSNRHNLALVHIPPTVEGMIERANRYTTLEAYKRPPRKITSFSLLFYPLLRFFSIYFGKAAFRCGTAGFILSANVSISEFYRLAKIYEEKVRHNIVGGDFGDLPEEVAHEKIRLINELRNNRRKADMVCDA